MSRVRPGELAVAIEQYLREYTSDVSAAIAQEIESTAKEIKDDIVARSPEATGEYKRGWRIKKQDRQGVVSRIIHNAAKPGLVHLLEHGHAKRGGGRTRAFPHVRPAAEPRLEAMAEHIRQILARGGGL